MVRRWLGAAGLLVVIVGALAWGCGQNGFELQNASAEAIDVVVHDGQGKLLWTRHLEPAGEFIAAFRPDRDGGFRIALTTASGRKLAGTYGYYTRNQFWRHVVTFDGSTISHRSVTRGGCD
jgi:hypothetical protein